MATDLRPVEEMRAAILGAVGRLESEEVEFHRSVGRVLVEPVTAGEDVPAWDNSGMDGYAVRASDTAREGAVLRVVGSVAAGTESEVLVGPGEALKIMTGAPLPPGADTVVRVEDTVEEDGEVRILVATEPGAHVRAKGGDVAAGHEVIPAGTRLTAGHVGLLASLGVTRVTVSRRPRVAVLSTGDELRPSDTERLEPGAIRDSNRPMLIALTEDAGADVIDLGSVGDDADQLRAAIGRGVLEADAIISTGGVSMGDHDVVKAVLASEAGVDFVSLAMSPGKPLGFGMVGGRPFFGLPGNPVSVMVSFEQLARPALLAMQGATTLLRPRVVGVAGERMTSSADKEAFLRARIVDHETMTVVTTGGQGSNVLSGAARADCFAVLPVGVDTVETGDSLTLELFRAAEARGVGDV
jgi:molybdopterin molybdotransferase